MKARVLPGALCWGHRSNSEPRAGKAGRARGRWSAAMRLPRRFLLRLRDDPHREVRIRIASHLEGEELMPMMSDPDYFVRQIVAQRIGVPQLRHMIDDPDPEVSRSVAQRI